MGIGDSHRATAAVSPYTTQLFIFAYCSPGASFEGEWWGQLPPPRPKQKIMCSAKLPTRVATSLQVVFHAIVMSILQCLYAITTQFPQFDASFLMRCRKVMLSFALLVMLCSQTIVPTFDRFTGKHADQNIQNDCHQWLSHSFAPYCTLSLLKTRSFFSVASAVIMFSHSGKQTGIVITTAHYLKHRDGQKTARNLVSLFLAKSIKLLPQISDFEAKMHQIRFRLGLRPRPRWGSLQRSPRPHSWISGCLHLRERGKEGNEEAYL